MAKHEKKKNRKKEKKKSAKSRTRRPAIPSGGDERYFSLRLDRTTDADTPLVDYLRIGNPSSDAMYDQMTTIEDHAIDVMTGDEAMDSSLDNLGTAGEFSYTPGSRTRYVGGDDFERVAGNAWKVYGSYHEVVIAQDDAGDSSDDSSSSPSKKFINKITGTKSLTIYDKGIGTYYEVKYGGSYYYKGDLSCIYEDNLKYECKISGALTSSLSIKFDLSVGTSLKDIKAKFSVLGYSAMIDGNGNYMSSKSLNVSSKISQMAKEKIVLGLSDTISDTMWVQGIWKTLLALAQVTNALYVATNIAAQVNPEQYEDKPENLGTPLTVIQTAAIAQGVIGMIFAAAALVHDLWYKNQVDDIKSQVGAVGYSKPFIQIKDNTIELNSGDGASIVLDGKTIYLNADGIELATGVSSGTVNDGITLYTNNGGISMNADHSSGALLTSPQGKTTVSGTELELTAFNTGEIGSNGTWTHNGSFSAGTTTVGDLTATSVTANGIPLAPAAPVINANLTRISIMEVNVYVNMVDPTDLLTMIAAL